MLKIAGGYMESFQRIGQSADGQVVDEIMEQGQGKADFPGMPAMSEGIVGPGVVDKAAGPPERSLGIDPKVTPLFRQQGAWYLPTAAGI